MDDELIKADKSEDKRAGKRAEGISEGWMSGGMEVWQNSDIGKIRWEQQTDNGYISINSFLYISKIAFTLAEVLVALGIIGVIASVTMPTLIQNHRRHVVETRLEKFYSSINQAVTLAEAEFGEREYWDWRVSENTLTDFEWFNKYLAKYIKALKIEEYNNVPVVYFSDGSAVYFSNRGITFFPYAKDCIEYLKQADDIRRKNSGKKFFTFFYYPNANKSGTGGYKNINKLVEPYKFDWDGTVSGKRGLTTHNTYGCKSDTPTYGAAYCAALIQFNNWKIPKDYPFRF